MRKRMVKTLVAVAAAATLLLSGAQGAGAQGVRELQWHPPRMWRERLLELRGERPRLVGRTLPKGARRRPFPRYRCRASTGARNWPV